VSAEQVTGTDALGGVNTDTRDAEAWTVLVAAVQFLPRILDFLSSFLRILPVLCRNLQSLHPRQSAEQARNSEQGANGPLHTNTYSTRSYRCCILWSICASCQRDRLGEPGRIPCRPVGMHL